MHAAERTNQQMDFRITVYRPSLPKEIINYKLQYIKKNILCFNLKIP